MKKILAVIITTIAILWILLSIFWKYNSNNILSNEASFEVFVDSSSFDPDEYFSLPKGTFEKEEYILVCKLPVEVKGFKASHVTVRTNMENIDCNAKFEKGRFIQYEPYELKGSNFELLLVNKNANLSVLNSPLGEKIVLARRNLKYNYSKGKVNRILLSKNGLSEYCK